MKMPCVSNAFEDYTWTKPLKQDAVVAYIWAWLCCAYVKFVMCMRDMWVVKCYCIFEGLVEMCLITEMMGVVCWVSIRGNFYWMLVNESNSVDRKCLY